MALAIHVGGPRDGDEQPCDGTPPVRYWAPVAARARDEWVDLARYVWRPPQDRAKRWYDYTGIEQKRGPIPGSKETPEWST